MFESSRLRIVVTFDTFDVFHIGHLRILDSAAAKGDKLIVGISTDDLRLQKKGRLPVYSQVEAINNRRSQVC
jgi:glycerol-3-phosphate cytidylyltransferase